MRFRVWSKKHKKMYESFSIWYALSGKRGRIDREDNELMIWTGLRDKNNRRIYEGDIVKYNGYYAEDKKPHNMYVEYDNTQGVGHWNGAAFALKEKKHKSNTRLGDMLSNGDKCTIEVIGNIYENKELL